MFKYFKKYWAIFIVFVLCFWAFKALLVPGFFPIHDDEQIARLFELDTALSDGQIPARWVPDLGFGFGYPFFNFYPPFTYYLGEAFHVLGLSFINSIKAVIFTGFLSSSLFMYLWVKNHFGKLPAIFSALLYTYSFYHAVDLYVRGDIPEFFSFVWIPAVFWSLDLLFKTQKLKYIVFLSVFLSLVVLTHSLIAFPFLFFLGAYVIFLMFSYKSDFKKFFLLVFSSSLISLLLSMFFWLPVFLEKKFTLVDGVLTRELASYKIHFVYLRQLWDSPWGYGGSIFGLYDGLSFEVGKTQLILSLLVFLVILFSYFKRKKLDEKFKLSLFIFVLLLFSLYMTSFYSQFIWDKVQLLSYLQFPWRFLLFSAVFSSFLGGFFIYLVRKYSKKISIILLLILSLIIILNSQQNFKPEKFLSVDDSFYTNKEDINWRVSKMSFEFVPNNVATKLSDIKTTQVDIDKKDIPTKPYQLLKGLADVQIMSNKSYSKIFKIDSKGKSTIQVNTFSFPGWEAKLDSRNIKYSDNNKLKLITVDIPNGPHVLTVNFVNTLPRAIGNAVSLVMIFNLTGFFLLKIWKK